MVFRRVGGEGYDIILVDRMDITTDYLAYQLARRGARVHLFSPSSQRPPAFLPVAYPYRSRQGDLFGDGPSDSFAALVERVDPACIIPCTEKAAYWLWKQPEHIQERCLPNVVPAIRPLLLDRALLLEKAADWGVAIPEAAPLNSHDDCLAATAQGFPLIVKSGQSCGSTGVALCRTSDEVAQAFEKFSQRNSSVAVQRFYQGPTYMAGGLFVNGEAVHFYAGEQTIMRPPLTGYSCEIRSAAEPHFSALLQAAESVCKGLEWTGLASFDFVLGEEDKFRLVDFNPRLWGAAGALIKAKVDVYGGIDHLIRHGDAGPPSRSIPDIVYRVFPKYTAQPLGMSLWKRLAGLRDAPWDAPFLVARELAGRAALRLIG